MKLSKPAAEAAETADMRTRATRATSASTRATASFGGLLALAACCLPTPAPALEKSYQAPPDTVQLIPSELPGYAKAKAACTSCHSAEYLQYQPPTASRAYWDAMVHRMKAVFRAPLDDADMPAIVDYLAATYGN